MTMNVVRGQILFFFNFPALYSKNFQMYGEGEGISQRRSTCLPKCRRKESAGSAVWGCVRLPLTFRISF